MPLKKMMGLGRLTTSTFEVGPMFQRPMWLLLVSGRANLKNPSIPDRHGPTGHQALPSQGVCGKAEPQGFVASGVFTNMGS